MFQNRTEAGRLLGKAIMVYKTEAPIVIALPRGGVPVGYEVARALDAPLDVIIVRKLGYPGQPDLAIGAVVDGKDREIVLNRDMFDENELPRGYLEREIAGKLKEIHDMSSLFRGHRSRVNVKNRTVIVVDDGIATGATMRVVVQRLRRDHPRKIVVATPVAPEEAIQVLRQAADEVVCLEIPGVFGAVGRFYDDFSPVSTDEVVDILDKSSAKAA